jgi:hypothetical protein
MPSGEEHYDPQGCRSAYQEGLQGSGQRVDLAIAYPKAFSAGSGSLLV